MREDLQCRNTIKQFEQTQDSLALLKILAVSTKNLKDGNYNEIGQSFKNIRNKIEVWYA